MPYPAFLLRHEAAAYQQLVLIGAVTLGMADQASSAIPLAGLREEAGV